MQRNVTQTSRHEQSVWPLYNSHIIGKELHAHISFFRSTNTSKNELHCKNIRMSTDILWRVLKTYSPFDVHPHVGTSSTFQLAIRTTVTFFITTWPLALTFQTYFLLRTIPYQLCIDSSNRFSVRAWTHTHSQRRNWSVYQIPRLPPTTWDN